MENTHRAISTIIQELLNHPDLVRLDWVNKNFIKDQFESYCEDAEVEGDFDEFWNSKSKELKENSYRMFRYNEYYLNSFLEDYFEMSNK